MFKDFFNRPCMRTAFLYGIGGGLGTGMAVFLFTSRVKRSADVGVSVFTAITLFSFVKCRYDRSKMKQKQKRYLELQGIETKDV
ncbi:putative cytochrome c oxidase protein 20-like isoform X1 [Apostichopus japonicus]|uniref:Cytochrome c oxidase assembly protein COX20, mitochondrial n=2 Tax=Stichopus japonicus TaxID=307972 RepID=A0A2G8LMR4_STIJA|nr:putative cytochrome c oxidase protein 20-like isoform X1 [Apostichopus japonicus]